MIRPLLVVFTVFAIAMPASARVVDGVVAAIGYKVIALSTAVAYRRAFAPGQTPGAALEREIDDMLLAIEARRYGQTLTPAALAEALARHPVPPGMGEAEWKAVVGDHELARQFLAFRFADFVPISREELRAYYEQHRGELKGSFASVEERIRERLTPEVRARRESEFVAELRARSQVRVNPELLERE